MEFDQVVKYEFGDDVRDIDWNVTARLGEPYRKKFVEERESRCCSSLRIRRACSSFLRSLKARSFAGTRQSGDAARAVNRDRVGYVYAAPGDIT